jgi:sugar lactone lactonase YvrE
MTGRASRRAILTAIFALAAWASDAAAHPASGIVVDAQGQVYFVYTGHGVMKIAADGKATIVHASKGGHWMCLDPDGIFSRAKPKYFERITPDGAKPAIIFADGGAPPVVNRDGNLYYGSWNSADDPFAPGGQTVSRLSLDGKASTFSPQLQETLAGINDGVTGLATAPDGSLYVAARTAILKVNVSDGSVRTLVHPITLADCDDDPPDGRAELRGPCLRGLAVDAKGNVYAAAQGCHRVVKVTPDGKASVILKADRPWSPTGAPLATTARSTSSNTPTPTAAPTRATAGSRASASSRPMARSRRWSRSLHSGQTTGSSYFGGATTQSN